MTERTELATTVVQPWVPAAHPPAPTGYPDAPPPAPMPYRRDPDGPIRPTPEEQALPEYEVGSGSVTCPGCATVGFADPAQRESEAFCRVCDYPLFWARERILAKSGTEGSDDSLRRLPGVVGRTALASIACPACTEPNPYNATHCRRCNSLLRPGPVLVVAPPVPAPLLLEPVLARPRTTPWILGIVLASIVLLALLVMLGNEFDVFSIYYSDWHSPHLSF